MNTHISENAPIRTIQHMINEAKALGLRVVHRPEAKKNNVVKLWDEDRRVMQAHTSPESV